MFEDQLLYKYTQHHFSYFILHLLAKYFNISIKIQKAAVIHNFFRKQSILPFLNKIQKIDINF